jgi:alpha-tubulin suppressor-like RCC1 family protein
MNRRQALSLLGALPFAARLGAQTRATGQHRIALAQGVGLLLEPGGTLKVWGCNPGTSLDRPSPADDELGLGHSNPVDAYALYAVPGLRNVVAAAAGSACFAVLADGRILAWGATGSGELGITPRAEFETRAQPRMRTNTPTPLAVAFDAVDVSCKDDHVMALARDGSVYTWGRGDSGQLGIGPLPTVTFKTQSARVMPYVPYPVRVPDLQGVVAIAAGNDHSMALLKDGTVRVWGSNKYGQVGDGSYTNRDRPLAAVPGVRNVVAIAAGGYRSVAVLGDGTVMEWGANHVNLTPRPVPALVPGVRGIRSVVAGGEHVAALTQTGEVMTWGQDSHYDTGRGRNASAPGLVKGVADVKSLAAAAGTTIAVLGSGRMLTWGEVRVWTRPDSGQANLSPFPILLWLDGLDQA